MSQAVHPFRPIGVTVALSATTSSTTGTALTATPVNRKDVVVYNAGAVTAFIKFGASDLVVATSDFPVPAGAQIRLHVADATHAGAITGSSTATVYVTSGVGD